MINSDSIHEMLMQGCQLQSLSEPSSATPSLQRHPHYNSTWVPEDYSTINNNKLNKNFEPNIYKLFDQPKKKVLTDKCLKKFLSSPYLQVHRFY